MIIEFTTPLEIECHYPHWTREAILRHIEEVLEEHGSDELIFGLPELHARGKGKPMTDDPWADFAYLTLDDIEWTRARIVLFQGIYYVKSLRAGVAAIYFKSDEDQARLKQLYEAQSQQDQTAKR